MKINVTYIPSVHKIEVIKFDWENFFRTLIEEEMRKRNELY